MYIAAPGLSQHARLITLDCTRAPDAAALTAERFNGEEGVNVLFRFDVDVLSASADLGTDLLLGHEWTLGLLQPDGSRRAWHGLCTRADTLGADGGLARYRLRLEPALALLQSRRDSHLYQDVDARAIVHDLLADYPDVQCTFDLTRALAPRAICTQYRETDLAFVLRLLTSEGLNFRFDHVQDDAPDPTYGRHRLVVFDSRAALPALAGGAALRFHGVRAADTDDAIDGWHARRRIAANGVAVAGWDPQQLVAPAAERASALEAGELPAMPVFDASGPAALCGDPAKRAQLMLQALEQQNKRFDGAGSVRRLAAGHTFTLHQHDAYPAGSNGFTVLHVRHVARNNVRTGLKSATNPDDPIYRNTFTCVRDTVALVPAAIAAPHPATVDGVQTARVVGLPDAVATTTRDHQVKIQFAWQRGARPNPGGLDHPGASSGNAPGDASSGAWVRVAEALAGPNWGSQFIPRIGTEVLVGFTEGDIDRPMVVGQLHTGPQPPPWPPAAGQSALSGIVTTNFAAGANAWQIDDSPGALRMHLATSSAGAELHLGHLAARGRGVDLRTGAMAVLRGGEGVLLSSTGRAAAGTSVTSTQMDVREAVALGHGATQCSAALLDAAHAHHALTSAGAATAQRSFVAQRDPQAQGKYDAPVGGQDIGKPVTNGRDPDPAQPVERFATPAVLLDAAASMNWATPAAIAVSTGQHLHWTTQADCHVAAGTTVSCVAGAGAALFTHSGGVKASAANGPVSLQAHMDQLEIVADKEVVAVSVSDAITIAAKTKIVLQAGQASITLDGAHITFACPGHFKAQGGMHVFDGGARAQASLTRLPEGALPPDTLYLDHRYHDDQPLAGAPYFVRFADGSEREGRLDAQGCAELAAVPPGVAQVRFGPMPASFKRVDTTPTPGYAPAPTEARPDGLIDRYLPPGENSDER